MNKFNTIIVEGTADGRVAERKEFFGFWISCEVGGEPKTFWVKAYGKLGEICKNAVEKNRVVRIVGALSHSENNPSDTFIVAEHIEFNAIKGGKR